MQELKDVFVNGVRWINPESKKVYTSRVVAPGVCRDAPVRAEIQDILHRGGRYCCNTCEQKIRLVLSVGYESREKIKRVFTFQEQQSRLRTSERMRVQGKILLGKCDSRRA